MKSGNWDGSVIYLSLHNRYIAYVYLKYCDYNGWNFPQRTFGFNMGKLLLFTFNGMLFKVNCKAKFCSPVDLVFWCLVIGLPSNVRHDQRTDGISGN